MSLFSRFVGGMGDAYQGVQQGAADAANRQALAEDREFQRTQRARLLRTQAREDAEADRAEKLREDLGKVSATKTVDLNAANPVTSQITVDDEGTPSATQLPANKTVNRTQDEVLRDVARAFKDAGKLDKFFELDTKADQIGMQRSAKLFAQVRSAAAGKTAYEIAREAADVYNNDPMPAKVTGVTQLPNGGAEVQFVAGDGKAITKQFAKPQEVLEALESYYSPDSYNALIKAKRDAAIKVETELAKRPVTTVPEGYVDNATKTFVRTKAGGVGGAGGSGSGKGGKLPPSRIDQVRGLIETATTKGETKFATPEVLTKANVIGAKLADENQSAPVDVIANVAVKVAMNPQLQRPEINMKTGLFDMMVADEETGDKFTLRQGVGSASKLPEGVKPEDAKAKTEEMLSRLDAQVPGASERYRAAAFDKTGKGAAELDAWTRQQLEAQMKTVPGFSALAPEQQTAAINQAVAIEATGRANRLALVSQFGRPPEAPKTPRIQRPGGIPTPASEPAVPSNSQAGEWRRRADAERERRDAAAAAEREVAQKLSQEFKADLASMKPLELARKYNARRRELSEEDAIALMKAERQIR